MSTTWDDFAAALSIAPAFPGARCRGRSHLFDPPASREPAEVVAQRHTQAIGLCQQCPALDACKTWLNGLSTAKKPHGIVAGQIIAPPPARKGN